MSQFKAYELSWDDPSGIMIDSEDGGWIDVETKSFKLKIRGDTKSKVTKEASTWLELIS